MSVQNSRSEHYLATMAARTLQLRFIEALKSETVLYVENDCLFSKSPNSKPVLLKHLSGRNPNLSKKFDRQNTYKIKRKT